MLEEKIKKYVNDQWFYASNKMACDPNLTTEYNLRNWINVLNNTHKDAKDPFEKECLKAYICFSSKGLKTPLFLFDSQKSPLMLSFCAQPQGGFAESIIKRITLALRERGNRRRRWVRAGEEHFPNPYLP